jgi:putative PIN family toxin of toxin-antitoxin system
VIRAVLDTNVLVSGSPASEGPLAEILRRWRLGAFDLVLSEYILDEAVVAWSSPYWRSRLAPDRTATFLSILRSRGEIVPLKLHVEGVAAHWHDDPILATALNGNAKYIVTGDKELLRLRTFRQTEIVSPREFLTRLDEAGAS